MVIRVQAAFAVPLGTSDGCSRPRKHIGSIVFGLVERLIGRLGAGPSLRAAFRSQPELACQYGRGRSVGSGEGSAGGEGRVLTHPHPTPTNSLPASTCLPIALPVASVAGRPPIRFNGKTLILVKHS